MLTINIEKAKAALVTLEREKQEQQHKLQLAAEAKRKLINNKATYSVPHHD